jgi:recombination protein RecT
MKKETQAAEVEESPKDIADKVLAKVEAFTETGELVLPANYSAANALKSAMIIIGETVDRAKKPALEVCTTASVAQALLKMVVEGLSPLKSQGYFIVYGNQLQWSRSYQGSIALAKRVGNVKSVISNVIYEDDSFEYRVNIETGFKELVEHDQEIENIDNNKIKGAYAVINYNDGSRDLEVMTIVEIKTAWNQGASKGNSPAHQGFTQEMCKKTVINRSCKNPINSSSDANLFIGRELEKPLNQPTEVKKEIAAATAGEEIDFEEVKNNDGVAYPEGGESEEPTY